MPGLVGNNGPWLIMAMVNLLFISSYMTSTSSRTSSIATVSVTCEHEEKRRKEDDKKNKGKEKKDKKPSYPPNIMDDAVRLLLPTDEAESYIEQYPGEDFRFFVYDDLPQEYTWQHISKCILDLMKVPADSLKPANATCDWGSSICTEGDNRPAKYSKRRFNRNGDVIMAQAWSEYEGSLRTYDPDQADVLIVPYPSAGHCECRERKMRCYNNIKNEELLTKLIGNLTHFTPENRHKHLFPVSTIPANMHPLFKKRQIGNVLLRTTLGPAEKDESKNGKQIVIPYANTNPENQPGALTERKSINDRKYAVGAVMSVKIANGGVYRKEFYDIVRHFPDNYTMAGLPINAVGLAGGRTLKGEQAVQDLYRDSIFCPCLPGDGPVQKRIFDAILGGCIPVVISHDKSSEAGYSSHYSFGGASTRLTYPFAKGSFHGMPNMGVDWEHDMVLTIDAHCGMKCLFLTLENMLTHQRNAIMEKQKHILKFASLFSFGMQDSKLQHPDAIVATMVQARHYINQMEDMNSNDNNDVVQVQ